MAQFIHINRINYFYLTGGTVHKCTTGQRCADELALVSVWGRTASRRTSVDPDHRANRRGGTPLNGGARREPRRHQGIEVSVLG